MMEAAEAIKKLEEIYDNNDCECINAPPYTRCKACTAAHALNDIGDRVREALKELEPLIGGE